MVEDFTTYTEVDEGSDLTVTASKIDASGLSRGETSYVYDDKGASHFDGDFEHWLEVYQGSSSENQSRASHWALSNDVGDLNWHILNAKDVLCFYVTDDSCQFTLYERLGGGQHLDSSTLPSTDTIYYLKIIRDGTNGYIYIYDDADRTSLVDTLSLSLYSANSFRYVYGLMSYNDGNPSIDYYGYTENLDLSPEGEPGVIRATFNVARERFNTGIAARLRHSVQITAQEEE